MRSDQFINLNEALQAHPEYLNDRHEDHDKATYAKGWNACNSRYFGELGNLKTVDIVRCQDCKWYKYGRHFTETKFCARLKDKDGNPVFYNFSPDDFCSHGVRRNDDDLPDDRLLDRLTQDDFDYCEENCNETGRCGYFTGQTDAKCGDAAIYDKLREYEQTGLAPNQIMKGE